MGLLDNENKQTVALDRNKLRRSVDSTLKGGSNINLTAHITAVYFDGRIESTLVQFKTSDGIQRPRTLREDHDSMVGYPEEVFLGHVTIPESEQATGKNIATKMFTFKA